MLIEGGPPLRRPARAPKARRRKAFPLLPTPLWGRTPLVPYAQGRQSPRPPRTRGTDGIKKRPAFRPILISGENGFRRPISEERLRPVTGTISFVRDSRANPCNERS